METFTLINFLGQIALANSEYFLAILWLFGREKKHIIQVPLCWMSQDRVKIYLKGVEYSEEHMVDIFVYVQRQWS